MKYLLTWTSIGIFARTHCVRAI